MNDLLRDPLFSIESERQDVRRYSLPGLLACLLDLEQDDPPMSFSRVTPAQRGLVWRFLVRTAAYVLRAEGMDSVQDSTGNGAGQAESVIRSALRGAAPDSAWLLHHEGPISEAAFLQPAYTGDGNSREQGISWLTQAIGRRQYERKSMVPHSMSPEEVVYGLIEYQLGVKQGGQGHYPTQLTGSGDGAGSGSPTITIEFHRGLAVDFVFAVDTLLAHWPRIRKRHGLVGDVWALWAEPWSGAKGEGLPASELSPAFIPCARIVRLHPPIDGYFYGVTTVGSKAKRVEDHTDGGNLGDIFVPLIQDPRKGHWKIRGVLEQGYNYKEVAATLFERTNKEGQGRRRPPIVDGLARIADDLPATPYVRFAGVAFSQGKTLGFFEREFLLPQGAVRHFEATDVALGVYEDMLALKAKAEGALSHAAAIRTGWEKGSYPASVALLTGPFEDFVDREYLPFLFRAADEQEQHLATGREGGERPAWKKK